MSQLPIDAKELDKFMLTSFAKDVYLTMLRDLFGQNPGYYHWDPNADSTRLVITDRFSAPKEERVFQPMIYLTRGRMGFLNTSLNQFMAGNLNTGDKRFADIIAGTMIINCVSREGLEAEELAGIVFTMTQALRAEFRKKGFHDFNVGEILEEGPLKVESISNLVQVPVSTSFSFFYSWALSIMNSTPLKEVCIARFTADPPCANPDYKGDPFFNGVCLPMGPTENPGD